MDNIFQNLSTETRINLALSYENSDIIEKFCSEYSVNKELAKEYFIEVKKFLYLCSSSDEVLAPSTEIDKIWHTFILFTKDYRLYCMHFLGKFIDHVPEVNKKDAPHCENYLLNTITNYKSVFGELNDNVWQIPRKTEENINCLSNDIDFSGCNSNCQSCSNSEGRGSQPSCVYTGNCFNCSNSGYSCVGENPNDI